MESVPFTCAVYTDWFSKSTLLMKTQENGITITVRTITDYHWHEYFSLSGSLTATKDGKLKVGRLEDFEDENMVASPVWNKTDLVKSYHDKVFKNDNPESATLLTKPYYLTENKDTIRLPKSSASGKYYLISPNGNTLFMYRPLDETSSYFGFSYNKEQQRVINDFLKKNNGAYPVMVDNGMFEHFYTPERRPNGNMLENYIPNDFSANPNDMHILGETKNPNSAEK